jgi:uncharacterized tellurite resistance protein B-like protein
MFNTFLTKDSIISKLAQLLLMFGLFATALLSRGCSMDAMRGVLEVQRLPISYAAGMVSGPSMIEATVDGNDASLSSRTTSAPVVYYDWVKEREQTDSEGDTTWVTVDSATATVNFHINDPTGRVFIKANSNSPEIYPTSLSTKYYGNYRETESVIRANAKVLVLGEYNHELGTIGDSYDRSRIRFTISAHGEAAILASRGWTSVFAMGGAVFSFVFAIGLLLNLFRIHHIMVSSVVVFVTLPPILFLQWTLVTSEQLTLANNRVEEYHLLVTDQRPAEKENTQLRQALIKRDAARAHELYLQYRDRVTNIAHKAFMGLNDLEMHEPSSVELDILNKYPISERIGTVLDPFMVGLLGTFGLIAMGLLGFIGYRKMGTKRMIENIPTSKAKGVFPGITEVVGTIQPRDTVISARYTGDAVVYCKYLLQRWQKSGKNSSWVTVESGLQFNVFNVRDDSGEIPVNPTGAEVHAARTYLHRAGNLKYHEWTLRADQEVYVLGPAVLDDPMDRDLMIRHSREERHFVISDQGENSLMRKYARVGLLVLGFALSFCIVAVMTIYGGASFDSFGYFAGALVALIFLIVLNIAFLFNDLVFVTNWQQRGKSNLDVSLKRRANLIPNLVRVVSEALTHERDLQTTLSELRGGDGKQPVGAMHHQFMALLEQYPDLKGNDVIIDLNNRIVAVENQLQYARTGFNAVTQRYNSRIKHFPELFLAKLMRLSDIPYFQLQHANEGNVVDVGKLLKTSTEQKSEQAQREKESRLALVSDVEIIIATLVCLMAVDGDIGTEEYQTMLRIVAPAQPNLDVAELRKLAQSVLEQIKAEGVNSVLSTTIDLARRLAGTDIGRKLIKTMNVIAEKETGVDSTEQAVLDRFRDVLGGQ